MYLFGRLLENSESDVLAYMDFPQNHWSKIYSTNPLERLNKEVKRRSAVVGIFPCEASIVRLIGAVLMGVINQGMSIMGMSANYQSVVKGIVVLVAILFDVLSNKKKK